ncbi:MAG: CehA/McbA family metallohydrolase [Deltaproteobacteria bacterium]|nr:CehA/McbA family metallohydrolase [Deltaproteobacteria bacterium]MBW1950418.1 CehA/McbA family metallohydrolase [Deltaproteobacteria bacterium]MBW2009616.1 CehA/McbA family metallohydrolase [Deltaproteobacteria bacterium]
MNETGKYVECVGNLHVHSIHSDGAGTVPEIALAAQELGLDFVILNDHEYMMDALHLEEEGYYGRTLVLVGQEIGERYHHYLAFGLEDLLRGANLSPQEVIDRVNRAGGFGFLAHPFEKGMPFTEKSVAYTWNDLTVKGFAGICIWNYTSRWKERVKTALHGIYCLIFKTLSLKPPSRETLAFWDGLCKERRVAAVGGSDAHGAVFRWGPFSFKPLSYEHLLNTITNHVLLNKPLSPDAEEGKAQIHEAIREGRLYLAHENLAKATGFRFEYQLDGGGRLTLGQEATFAPGKVRVHCPERARITLVGDGREILTRETRDLETEIGGPGVYRVEVYLRKPFFGWRPWIYSNPIYLR